MVRFFFALSIFCHLLFTNRILLMKNDGESCFLCFINSILCSSTVVNLKCVHDIRMFHFIIMSRVVIILSDLGHIIEKLMTTDIHEFEKLLKLYGGPRPLPV